MKLTKTCLLSFLLNFFFEKKNQGEGKEEWQQQPELARKIEIALANAPTNTKTNKQSQPTFLPVLSPASNSSWPNQLHRSNQNQPTDSPSVRPIPIRIL